MARSAFTDSFFPILSIHRGVLQGMWSHWGGFNKGAHGTKLLPTTILAYPVDCVCSCHLLNRQHCCLCLHQLIIDLHEAKGTFSGIIQFISESFGSCTSFTSALSLSTVVLNSRDWYEIIWLPEISRFKNQPCNRFYPKKPAGMHW